MIVTDKQHDYKEKPILCSKYRSLGHLMKIYLLPIRDKSGRILGQQPYNFYSNTRHFCMQDRGNDTAPEEFNYSRRDTMQRVNL
jgi:hypothetical protein